MFDKIIKDKMILFNRSAPNYSVQNYLVESHCCGAALVSRPWKRPAAARFNPLPNPDLSLVWGGL
jgi:hypothetical protein